MERSGDGAGYNIDSKVSSDLVNNMTRPTVNTVGAGVIVWTYSLP